MPSSSRVGRGVKPSWTRLEELPQSAISSDLEVRSCRRVQNTLPLLPPPPPKKKEIKEACKCDRTQSTVLNSYVIHCDHLKLNYISLKKGWRAIIGLSCSHPFHDDKLWDE